MQGGGIHVREATATITNCNIHDNHALATDNHANGYWAEVRSLAASNCARALSWKFLPSPRCESLTACVRTVVQGGGIDVYGLVYGVTATITDCIIHDNSARARYVRYFAASNCAYTFLTASPIAAMWDTSEREILWVAGWRAVHAWQQHCCYDHQLQHPR